MLRAGVWITCTFPLLSQNKNTTSITTRPTTAVSAKMARSCMAYSRPALHRASILLWDCAKLYACALGREHVSPSLYWVLRNHSFPYIRPLLRGHCSSGGRICQNGTFIEAIRVLSIDYEVNTVCILYVTVPLSSVYARNMI